MKIVVAAVVLTGIMMTAANADEANGNAYISGSMSYSMTDDLTYSNRRTLSRSASFEDAIGGSAAIGYDFGGPRIELQGSMNQIDFDKISDVSASGDIDVKSAFVNAAYDFGEGRVQPFVLAGLGVSDIDGNASYTSNDGTVESASFDGTTVAGQVGLGATIYVTDNVGLVGGYKWTHYLGAEEVTTDFVGQHNFEIGLRVNF